MMISCLSPELKLQIFYPFFFSNKLGRGLCFFQESAMPFNMLMHLLDSMPKAWCGVSCIIQAGWESRGTDEGQGEQPLSAQTFPDGNRQRTGSPRAVQTEEDLFWHQSRFPFPE